jgi:serine/threonine-protein kinase
VALKILPAAFAADPERLARFRREAQVLASLNHPHIAQIHGFEDSGSVHALVLELVEGDTLADRIGRGAVPVAEALTIGRQIAEALEAAHEAGIVHRDLKPANVKVRDDGTVKVLDFGLAKALDAGAVSDDRAHSATMTSPAMTGMGIILGTAAYMSPEQAKGKAIDKRADIWAFGVVLCEMLTGRTLFAGETISETIASVIKDPPQLDRLPPDTPPAVHRLIARCLERDPKRRLRDIGEARIVLADPREPEGAAPQPSVSRRMVWLLPALAVILAAAVGAIVWRTKPATDLPLRRFELPEVATDNLSLAPDGSRVAYVSNGHLFVRTFAEREPQDLGVVHLTTTLVAWSPDSRTIVFTAEGKIRSIPVGGGPSLEICPIPSSGRVMSAAWRNDASLVFGVWRDGLFKVSPAGGSPEPFVAIDAATEIDFHSVSALPDNRLVVVTHVKSEEPTYRVELLDAGGRRRTVLLSGQPVAGALYGSPGYLLLVRVGTNQGIWATPFRGAPIDYSTAVLVEPGTTSFDVAQDGTLIFLPAAAVTHELVWVDRSRKMSLVAGAAFERRGNGLSISPDGRRVLFAMLSGTEAELVVRDLETGLDTRMTRATEPQARRVIGTSVPSWSASGDRLFYAAGIAGALSVFSRRADGGGDVRPVGAGAFTRVSPDGRYLLTVLDDRGRGRLRYAPIAADGTVGAQARVFADGEEPDINWVDLSPEGVLAYGATQPDGRSDLFVTTFPNAAGRLAVTSNGGTRPHFSRNGRELFYLTGTRDAAGRPSGRLMSVPITTTPALRVGVATEILSEDAGDGLDLTWFDIGPDGRFLMTRSSTPAANSKRAVLVQNWLAAIKK